MVQGFAHPPSGVYVFAGLTIPRVGSLCTISQHPVIVAFCFARRPLSEPLAALAAPMQFTKMSGEELRLAKMWYDEDDMSPREIADLLRPGE